MPGSPVVKTLLSLQGAQVQSLVRELRSHMPHGTAPTSPKNKTLKNKNVRWRWIFFFLMKLILENMTYILGKVTFCKLSLKLGKP